MTNLTLLERRLKALANGRRLLTLQLLKKKHSMTVGDLARMLGISIEAMSKHLSILRAADIVRTIKRGLHVSYRLALHQEQPVRQVIALL